jgi:hypothetical protein
MDFPGNFRLHGRFDIAPLLAKVNALNDADWQRDSFRQRAYRAHACTQSIPLVYDEDFRYTGPSQQSCFENFSTAIEPLLNIVAESFKGRGYLLRLLLTRMPPGGAITPHIDQILSLQFVHRLHIPVITNNGVQFTINDEVRHLEAGEIWEINNCRCHSVVNAGTVPRVHLILDWVTPELAKKFLQQQVSMGLIKNPQQPSAPR